MYLSNCFVYVPGDSISRVVDDSEVKSSIEGDAPVGVVEICIDLLPQDKPCCWTTHLNGREVTEASSTAPQSARRIAAMKRDSPSCHIVIELRS